ncbi:MAG TPA: gamma carbonic anhydrase family protein [Acidimicrobiia bacterium]|jgi:carbonic anhydrase/acetyltransferase-like protein (isoleucine patch superfamily)|nr:gamma carbonic anhydrase family protein [Acidimicrobiia bacterium]
MPLFSFEGLTPQVHATAFIAPTATLVGDVIVEEGASVWYGAVIRADYAPVIVRRNANVQDNAVIHGPPGLTSDIGPGSTIGHNCVVHGAILEEECLVANGCVVLDGATVGARSLVAAGSVVSAGFRVPPGMLAAGAPAVIKRPVKGTGAELWVDMNPGAYAELAQRHRAGVRFIDFDPGSE